MDQVAFFLPLIWASLIGVAVAMYIVLDGFDLGVGILFPTVPQEQGRDQMMNSVAPFWDGNETWLVLGGGGLWVAFPTAYAIIMPALYEPVIVMLLALIFRGVAFEFRWVTKPGHRLWDIAFAGGSITAAFAQGIILGTLVQGIPLEDGRITATALHWATPFTLMCGLGVIAGYGLLGATWLVFKTDGPLAAHARKMAGPLLVTVALFALAVSAWTPLMREEVWNRWFSMPNLFLVWPLPAATAGLIVLVWRSLARGDDIAPFVGTIGIFLLAYLGLAVSWFPYLVPPSLTLWQAAAAPQSQIFSLIGAVFLLPVILGYTAFVYWTFRGKVKHGAGYH